MSSMASRAIAGDAHYFEDALSPQRVKAYLASMKDVDQLKGMKHLLAQMSKGRDVSEMFPDVVKLVVVRSVEVKKMVYNYLVHYADADQTCREISLLSINSFQKDLAATNQLIRGLALRVMTSIRVPDIIQIQVFAVRKCATDSSPYVRKCAANAVPKIFSLDPTQVDLLKEILERLLKDSSTMVLGSAVAAFNEICPEDMGLLHRSYRKLCHLLADMDEWSQIIVLSVLARYVRLQFTDPAPSIAAARRMQAQVQSSALPNAAGTGAATPLPAEDSKAAPASDDDAEGASATTTQVQRTRTRRVVKKAFYSDEEDESDEEEVTVTTTFTGAGGMGRMTTTTSTTRTPGAMAEPGSVFTGGDQETEGDLDPDHRLILRSSLPLLKSRNSGVVLGVCTLHYYCGTQSENTTAQVAKAMVRILRNEREIQYIVLGAINNIAQERPYIFQPFLREFFVKGTDAQFSRLLKLEIITALAAEDNVTEILRELQTYVRYGNEEFVQAAIRSVARVADAQPQVADRCIEGLMQMPLAVKSPQVVGEALHAVRQLLLQNLHLDVVESIVCRVAKQLLRSCGVAEPDDSVGGGASAVAASAAAPDGTDEDGARGQASDAFGRAAMVWIVSEFHQHVGNVAPDILRLLAARFREEDPLVKTQIMNLAVKLSLRLPTHDVVQDLMSYVLELARYDTDFDLRDRARSLIAVLGLAPNVEEGAPVDEAALETLRQHAERIILPPKAPPVSAAALAPVLAADVPQYTMGSLAFVVGHDTDGYRALPDFPEEQPDPTVRDAGATRTSPAAADADPFGAGGGSGAAAIGGSEFIEESHSTSEEESDEDEDDGDADFFGIRSSSDEDDDDDDDDDEDTSDDDDDDDDDESDDDDDESDDDEDEEDEEEEERQPIAVARAKQPSPSRKGLRRVTKNAGGGVLGTTSTTDTLVPTTTSAANTQTSSVLVTDADDGDDDDDVDDIVATSTRATNGTAGGGDLLHQDLHTGGDLLTGGPSTATIGELDDEFNPKAPSASSSTSAVDQIMKAYDQGAGDASNASRGAGGDSDGLVGDLAGLQQQTPTASESASPIMSPSAMPSGGGARASADYVVSDADVFSTARLMLRAEVCGGLKVDYQFKQGGGPASRLVAVFLLTNTRDSPMRRIKVTLPADVLPKVSTGQMSGMAWAPAQPAEVASIDAGDVVRVPVVLDLASEPPKKIRVDVRNDRGLFQGQLEPSVSDDEFNAARTALQLPESKPDA